jgi:hypothetical protein
VRFGSGLPLKKRQDRVREYFNQLARQVWDAPIAPGRTWQGLSHLHPPLWCPERDRSRTSARAKARFHSSFRARAKEGNLRGLIRRKSVEFGSQLAKEETGSRTSNIAHGEMGRSAESVPTPWSVATPEPGFAITARRPAAGRRRRAQRHSQVRWTDRDFSTCSHTRSSRKARAKLSTRDTWLGFTEARSSTNLLETGRFPHDIGRRGSGRAMISEPTVPDGPHATGVK